MNVQAEVSLYPLRTNGLGEAIESFLGVLEKRRQWVPGRTGAKGFERVPGRRRRGGKECRIECLTAESR